MTSKERQRAILVAFRAVCHNIIPQETVFNAASVAEQPRSKSPRIAKTRQHSGLSDSPEPKKTLLDSLPLDTAQILADFQGANFSFQGKS